MLVILRGWGDDSESTEPSGVAMNYEVHFNQEELELLRRLRGDDLLAIVSDGWAYFLRCGAGVYQVTVLEEATPDESHRAGDVTRPQLQVGEEPETPHSSEPVVPAKVLGVSVLRTFVTMSPPEQVENETIAGVAMPPHTAYGPVFMHPEDERLRALQPHAGSGNALSLTSLDIGFKLTLDEAESVSVHTDGATFFPTVSRGSELRGIPNGVLAEINF